MTADEQGYNGWKNYETWAVALWIDNEQGSYDYARELTRTTQGQMNPLWSIAGDLANGLKDWIEQEMPNLGGTLWADLLNAAFDEVDWLEIAENYLEETP